MENKTFVVSDDSINSYGFRVLTSGIKIDNFVRNPIMLFNHESMSWGGDVYNGPIGRWENLSITDGELRATSVFDVNDPKGKIINDKVTNGFLNAASIGFKILKTSEAPEDMVPGQTRPTVTECELIEISVVVLPANSNALALYDQDNKKVDLKNEDELNRVNLGGLNQKPTINTNTIMKLKLNALLIGLSWVAESLGFKGKSEGEEVEFTAETLSEKFQGFNTQIETLSTEKSNLETQLSQLNTANTELKSQLDAANAAKLQSETKVTELNNSVAKEQKKLSAVTDALKLMSINYELKDDQAGNPVFNKVEQDSGEWTEEKAREARLKFEAEIEANRKKKAGK